jgi:hypothetical protein
MKRAIIPAATCQAIMQVADIKLSAHDTKPSVDVSSKLSASIAKSNWEAVDQRESMLDAPVHQCQQYEAWPSTERSPCG